MMFKADAALYRAETEGKDRAAMSAGKFRGYPADANLEAPPKQLATMVPVIF